MVWPNKMQKYGGRFIKLKARLWTTTGHQLLNSHFERDCVGAAVCLSEGAVLNIVLELYKLSAHNC